MENFLLNLTQMYTATGQCAEPILPLYQFCQGHWWGYESHLAIVLVWLVVVIQKWRAFRRPKHNLLCTVSKRLRRSARMLAQRILVTNRRHKHGLRVWQSPVDCFTVLCSDCPDNHCLYCSNYYPAFSKKLLLVTGYQYLIHFWCERYAVI